MEFKKPWTIGSDPEFMLLENGKPVSTIGRMPTKDNPGQLRQGGYFYADNILLEMAIPPSSSRYQFINMVGSNLGGMVAAIYPHTIRAQASHEFDEEAFTSPEAFAVGCRPEYCVYHMKDGQIEPIRTQFDESSRLRSCGGHIHLGAEICQSDPVGVVKNLDFIVGIASVLMDKDPTSKRRREIYGGAGYHRPTPYGLEWRTLSNYWLASPALVGLIYDLCKETLLQTEAQSLSSLWVFVPDVIKAINNHDKQLAGQLWENVICKVLPKDLIKNVEQEIEKAQASLYDEWGIAAHAQHRQVA